MPNSTAEASGDLNRKMARGAAWLVLFKLADRAIGFVSTLILARILVPEDFGIVAMGTSMLGALEMLSAFNFDIALIQNPRALRRHYDTAWTFQLLFALFTALMMCALAIPAAHFFAEPRVTWLMVALGLCSAIRGFDNIGVVAFQKDLELHKEFKLGMIKRLAGFVVTIVAAFALRNYWALVLGMLTLRLVGCALSYRMHLYRPRWSLEAARELFQFSVWLLLNNALIFLNNRGSDFLIGRLGGPASLGLYALSYELANLPTTELVFPIQRAVFPGYSRIASDPIQLREAFLKVLSVVAIVTVPAGALIGLLANPLVLTLLGPRWLGAVPLIEVLALFGIVRSLHGPNGSIYLALGRPHAVAGLQGLQLFIAVGLMLQWIPVHGVIGAAWAILVGALIAMGVNFAMVLRAIQLPFGRFVAALWRPSVAVVGMALLLRQIEPSGQISAVAPHGLTTAVILVVQATTGVVCYLLAVLLLWFVCRCPPGIEKFAVDYLHGKWRKWREGKAKFGGA